MATDSQGAQRPGPDVTHTETSQGSPQKLSWVLCEQTWRIRRSPSGDWNILRPATWKSSTYEIFVSAFLFVGDFRELENPKFCLVFMNFTNHTRYVEATYRKRPHDLTYVILLSKVTLIHRLAQSIDCMWVSSDTLSISFQSTHSSTCWAMELSSLQTRFG